MVDVVDGRYAKISYLGQGAFGRVYKVKRNSDGLIFAMKEFQAGNFQDNKHEIIALQKLDHHSIVRYVDSNRDPPYLIMEYCHEGNLEAQIKAKKYSEKESVDVIRQILSGLQECHSKKIIHRDLKPANVLIKNNIIKIGDFGLAKDIGSYVYASTQAGTRCYMAPEIFQGKKYDSKIDIWAAGCILYEMIEGTHPFLHENMLARIMSGKYKQPTNCSGKLTKLIEKMLQPEPSSRISASQALLQLDDNNQIQNDNQLADLFLKKLNFNKTQQAFNKPQTESVIVKFEGSVGYTIKKSQEKVEIRAAKVMNKYNGVTGSIKIELWAIPHNKNFCSKDYETAAGYCLGRYQFKSQLKQNQYFEQVEQTIDFTNSGKFGQYHKLVMKLMSYYNNQYYTVDNRVFDGFELILSEKVEFEGSTEFESNGDEVVLKCDKICNNQSTKSGTIRLLLAACSEKSNLTDGDYKSQAYYTVAIFKLGELESREYYHNVQRTVGYEKSNLPKGAYRYVMKLQQYSGKEYNTEDQRVYKNTIIVY